MIQIDELTRSYLTEEVETSAVRNLSLRVDEGEFVAVMGPSGCGKSTLLNLLGLIDRPSSGTYLFRGNPVNSLSENQMTGLRRGNMGFIFQNYNLVDELSVMENVELPLVFMGVKRRERRERAMKILELLNIGHRSRHYPSQLSGGQQQRVAFARAVVNEPVLLLADEPTGNLDSRNRTRMMELLTDHNRKGGTVVMVTHSPKDASYAHRIIHLRDGAIKTESEK
ncbi:MAG: ABC transporter ATP-binding protein [Bacteroidetes bacterium]|nr:ABC transporter ATP-binding protein [Bacteroidota bacterium]